MAARINAHVNWAVVVLSIGAVMMYRQMRRAEAAPESKFRCVDFYTDAAGHADYRALAYLGTVFTALVILVYQTLTNQLTEWLVANVLGFVSLASSVKAIANASRDKAIAQFGAPAPPCDPPGGQ
jgi:hypothetical protein